VSRFVSTERPKDFSRFEFQRRQRQIVNFTTNILLAPWVNFTNKFARLFYAKKMRSSFWRMSFGKRLINLANFTLHIGQISLAQDVGEIEQ